MSRAYRIKVRESVRQVIRASDHVGTRLELLEILPPEAMADLLRRELLGRGFQPDGETLVRRRHGVTIAVAPETGTVTVQAEASEAVTLEAASEGYAYEEARAVSQKKAEEKAREGLRAQLAQGAQQKTAALQKQVTDRLERQLIDLRPELDQVVNRVTAEALKRKAAQIGQIKEITEDPQSGSLTIVLDV